MFKKKKRQVYQVCWVDSIVWTASGTIAVFYDEKLAREYVEYLNNTWNDKYIDFFIL